MNRTDEFSEKYNEWCKKKKHSPGTYAIVLFHKSKSCPEHDKCNYCSTGAMV